MLTCATLTFLAYICIITVTSFLFDLSRIPCLVLPQANVIYVFLAYVITFNIIITTTMYFYLFAHLFV